MSSPLRRARKNAPAKISPGEVFSAAAVFVLVALMFGGFAQPASAQVVNRNDILYIMPFMTDYSAANVADMRSRLGPEGPNVKLGFTVYINLQMQDWNVDITNATAVKAAIQGGIDQIDSTVAYARSIGVPCSLAIMTAIRGGYDPVQRASEAEDIRNMQWYADNILASGWWTHSRYARRQFLLQQAYMREIGKEIARLMRLYPETLVSADGDGEVELAAARNSNVYADYSPFTVAEFRDWLRLGGLYAPTAEYAGQGWALGARYAGDRTPGEDTNGDGHTLNGDFGTNFQTWSLLHFDWNLSDQFASNDPGAVSLNTYNSTVNHLPANTPGGFDPPRTPMAIGANAWWDLWVLFKTTMIQRHNIEVAKWMTTSPDPTDPAGFTVPRERWYSYQIPADYLTGSTPLNPNPRLYSSASAWWTADVSPYGSYGITSFNVDSDGTSYAPFGVWRTLINVAPEIARRGVRWALTEWHPGQLTCQGAGDPTCGVSTKLDLYRSEMIVIEHYRPGLLQPFIWGQKDSEIKGTGFEIALREFIARVKDGWPLVFRGPATGGPASGTVSGSNLIYNGGTYPIVNNQVTFPDCTVYLVGGTGTLTAMGTALSCTPGAGNTPNILWTSPAPISYGTALGTTQLNATADVPGTFVYTPPVGTVLNVGLGQALSVTFTPTDTLSFVSVTKAVTLDVTRATTFVTWANPAPIAYGTALSATQLNATANVAGTFVYGPAAGSVLNAGAGQVLSVTFTPTDAAHYSSVTKTVTIDVTKVTPIVTWATPAAITGGTALSATQLNATANVPGTMLYSPAAGTVLGAGAGQTLSVTFTPTDGVNYTLATKTVTIDVGKTTSVITWANPSIVTVGTLLSSTQLNATASVAGAFVYTPPAGTALSTVGTQTLSVTFTPTDTTNYTTATKTVTIDVTSKKVPVLTWANPASITYGIALSATQLNATADAAGTFVYTPAGGTGLNAGLAQVLSVTFTPTDTATYVSVTKTVRIDVTKATPVVAWANPASIGYGTVLSAVQLNAGSTVAGTLVYVPALGVKLNAGLAQTLSVTFTPIDTANYTTATKAVTIDVTKATSVLSWATPGAIMYGTPLSAAQLNATASVPGALVYNPAAGTVLQAGAQTLSVTFTPTDAANYTSATANVTLTVNPFVGPSGGGPSTGSVSGSILTYSGATYPIVNGKVTFPDCTIYIAMTGGMLIPAGSAPGCTPPTGGSGGGSTPPSGGGSTPPSGGGGSGGSGSGGGSTFAGPGTGGPPSSTVSGNTVTYNGATYTRVNGRVTFPDCTVYIVMDSGLMIPAGTAAGCVPTGTGGGGGTAPTTPVITWANPASVAVGTTLSGTQLNASASVAGSYAYNPSAGTVMNTSGSQTLSVTFTPSDTTNYTTATRSVTLTVTASGGTGGGGGGTAFVGPGNGGPSSGTVSGNVLTYNGATYPITNGRVTFPDCTSYIALGNGMLIPGGLDPACTPSGSGGGGTGGSGGGTGGSGGGSGTSGFVGPGNGGPTNGSVNGTTLTYNGATYLIVNGKVTFPDCTVYIAMSNGMLLSAGTAPGCIPSGDKRTP